MFVCRYRTDLFAGRRTQAQQRRRAAAWIVEPNILAHASLRYARSGATGSASVRAFLYGALPSTGVAGGDTQSGRGAGQATAADSARGRSAAECAAAH